MPSYRSRLADMLGLRFIATGVPIEQIDKRLQPDDLPLVARTNHGYIYENTQRFAARSFREHGAEGRFRGSADVGRLAGFQSRNDSVAGEPAGEVERRRAGTSAIRTYGNTEIVIDVESPDGGWVVVNDPWHPWWFATMDGRDVPILRANVLFRAVAVPPGRHFVTLRFEASARHLGRAHVARK